MVYPKDGSEILPWISDRIGPIEAAQGKGMITTSRTVAGSRKVGGNILPKPVSVNDDDETAMDDSAKP